MDEATTELTAINEAQSSIELTKGVRGEYGWKIKLYIRDELVEDAPKRIETINAKMVERFS